MKTKHFAWPLLVGWALIVPPPNVETPAQISDWFHIGSYQTAKECEDQLNVTIQLAQTTKSKYANNFLLAHCVPMEMIYKPVK